MKIKKNGLTTAEMKIMIVIGTFTVFSTYTLARYSNSIANTDKLLSALTDYFKCEALGHVPGRCSREPFERLENPYVNALSYLLLGCMILSILNFVIKWRMVTKGIRLLRQKSSFGSSKSRSTVA